MIAVEMLSPARRAAFLASRNSLFTPVTPDYWDRAENPNSPFPVRTYIGLDGSKVVAWSSFYLRHLELPAMKVGMACAIGTLPDYQRQGLGAKVWRAAEEQLTREADAVVVYTGEGGKGYPFYRAMGYQPLLYPRCLQLNVSTQTATDLPQTASFNECRQIAGRRDEVFASCYQGHAGFMAGRPESLNQWADASFFYDPASLGCTPQISWLDDWRAYAIWAGPIEKVGWKRGAVEIWELACREDCDLESLTKLLKPACAAARHGKSRVDWWAVTGHALTEKMLALGFVEQSRGLSVLGKIFEPAKALENRLRVACTRAAGGRVDVQLNDSIIEIERDAATRMTFGRSTASLEHVHGLLTIRPQETTAATLKLLDEALPTMPWAYLASEYI